MTGAATSSDPSSNTFFARCSSSSLASRVYDVGELGESEFDAVLFAACSTTCAIHCSRWTASSSARRSSTLTMPGEERRDAPADLSIDDRDELTRPGRPAMAFEHELAGYPTNWWAPNAAGVEAMLRSCGLEIRAHPGHEIWLCAKSDQRWMAGARKDVRGASGTGNSVTPWDHRAEDRKYSKPRSRRCRRRGVGVGVGRQGAVAQRRRATPRHAGRAAVRAMRSPQRRRVGVRPRSGGLL